MFTNYINTGTFTPVFPNFYSLHDLLKYLLSHLSPFYLLTQNYV